MAIIIKKTYNQGQLVETQELQIPDEIKDRSDMVADLSIYIPLGRAALKNWGSLSAAQKDTILKNMLKLLLVLIDSA